MRPRLNDPIGPNGETRQWLILASIRAGGYPQVAAQAYGVATHRFQHWLRRSRSPKAPRKLRRFMARVHEAAARARLKAEMTVYESDPRFWLRHGPGKETQRAPGWSALAKPIFEAGGAGMDELLTSPEFQTTLAKLMAALEVFPEARVVAAEALFKRDMR